ncbi:AbiH family protein [Pectinatus frisingensis]|uniref:AbiH family protein n=1 Tax=Pectinatus frisingensis TaxID=865 RepID=UPI0018C612F0|nr:AbiH family protein [Pectinatus frisingensis]
MNILVVGNGFDLAHKLPTSYIDFLEFTNKIKELCNASEFIFDNVITCCTDKYFKNIGVNYKDSITENLFDHNSNLYAKYGELLKDIFSRHNMWLNYFNNEQKNKRIAGINWIDFELEISKIIKCIEKVILFSKVHQGDERKEKLSLASIDELYKFNTLIDKTFDLNDKDVFMDTLYNDLNSFVKLLNIYFFIIDNIVDKIKDKTTLDDINNINVDKIISFNYTHTYKNMYNSSLDNRNNIDFIHGEAGKDNLVLGTEETLEDEKLINNEISCIKFKKYFQRIYNNVGIKYKDWVDTPDTDSFAIPVIPCHNIYIFGHSMDITDKDILGYIIKHKNVKTTTIYYHNEKCHAKQIANLVKILGKDEVIKRTGSNNIIFKKQINTEKIDTKSINI